MAKYDFNEVQIPAHSSDSKNVSGIPKLLIDWNIVESKQSAQYVMALLVVLCLLIALFFLINRQNNSESYGNYQEMQKLYPNEIN